MPRVRISDAKLAGRRQEFFNDFLRPILPPSQSRQGGHIWVARQPTLGGGGIALAAHDGNRTLNYRDWRFPTYLQGFRAQYFEIWMPTDRRKPQQWYLQQAYLNIFQDIKEYLCLHSDPEEPDAPKAHYKQGPHLHIKVKIEDPISKSHIALADGYINKALASEHDLFRAMRLGVGLIRDEILSRFE